MHSAIAPTPPAARRVAHVGAVLAWALLLAAAGTSRAAPVTVTVTDAAGTPLADATVAVYVKGSAGPTPGSPVAELGQRNKQFEPRLLVVQTGTAISFPNHDRVRHHVYSFSPAKVFELKLYAGTPLAPVVFDKPGIVALGCNIHDQMSAYIRVVDTKFYALTDAQGKAVLDLPAGEHQIDAWHPSGGVDAEPPRQPLKVGAAPAAVTVTVAVKPR